VDIAIGRVAVCKLKREQPCDAAFEQALVRKDQREESNWLSTFFFRDQQVLEKAVEHCLPGIAGRNHPRIWDAGAAMGQEPYTVSILFAERMGHFAFNNLRIDATDVENTGQFAQVIAAGLYPKDELSRLPEASWRSTSKPMANRDTFAWSTRSASGSSFNARYLLCFKEIGHDLLAGRVQKRAAPLLPAGKGGSAEDVQSGVGAKRALGHRADAGDALGTRVVV